MKFLYFEKDQSFQEKAKNLLEPWGYKVECVDTEKILLEKVTNETFDEIFLHNTDKSIHNKVKGKNVSWTISLDNSWFLLLQQFNRYIVDSPKARKLYRLSFLLWYDQNAQLAQQMSSNVQCLVTRVTTIGEFFANATIGLYDYGIAFDKQSALSSIKPYIEHAPHTGFYLSTTHSLPATPDHLYRKYCIFGQKVCGTGIVNLRVKK